MDFDLHGWASFIYNRDFPVGMLEEKFLSRINAIRASNGYPPVQEMEVVGL